MNESDLGDSSADLSTGVSPTVTSHNPFSNRVASPRRLATCISVDMELLPYDPSTDLALGLGHNGTETDIYYPHVLLTDIESRINNASSLVPF